MATTTAAVRIARRRPCTDDWLHRSVRAGIGVFLSNEDRTVTLARPRPWPHATPESWWFAESAYTAYIHHTGQALQARSRQVALVTWPHQGTGPERERGPRPGGVAAGL